MPLLATPTGAQAIGRLVNVTFGCGHTVRCHLFLTKRAGAKVLELLAVAYCPRCGGELPLDHGDAIFWPTFVAHCHDGPCGDDAPDVQRWLAGVGALLR